jgi:hypothetical protein
MKSLKYFSLIALLIGLFSFVPKSTSSVEHILSAKEVKQTLTLNEYNITLTNPTGWYLVVWVTPASSTGQVQLSFTATITEPNGTVLSGLHFVFHGLSGGTYSYPTGYEYQLVVPVSESGYPAGSSVSQIGNISVIAYTPFP